MYSFCYKTITGLGIALFFGLQTAFAVSTGTGGDAPTWGRVLELGGGTVKAMYTTKDPSKGELTITQDGKKVRVVRVDHTHNCQGPGKGKIKEVVFTGYLSCGRFRYKFTLTLVGEDDDFWYVEGKWSGQSGLHQVEGKIPKP